jgi:hypothetical protein
MHWELTWKESRRITKVQSSATLIFFTAHIDNIYNFGFFEVFSKQAIL